MRQALRARALLRAFSTAEANAGSAARQAVAGKAPAQPEAKVKVRSARASAARADGRVCALLHAQAAPLGSKQPVAPKSVMEQSIPPAAEVHASLLHLVPQIPWKPGYRRTGLIGRKVGMAAVWDEWGQRHPVTVIEVRLACVAALPARLVPNAVRAQILQNQVLALNPGGKRKNGEVGMVIAAGNARFGRTPKPLLGQYARAFVEPKRKVRARTCTRTGRWVRQPHAARRSPSSP